MNRRKIIQVAVAPASDDVYGRIVVLCNDGAVFTAWDTFDNPNALFNFKWTRLPSLPQE